MTQLSYLRCWVLTMHIHRVVVHHANSACIIEDWCSFLNKLNMIFHTNSFAHLLCDYPRCLNRVSSRSKRIGKEETRYRKPLFWVQLIVKQEFGFHCDLCRLCQVCARLRYNWTELWNFEVEILLRGKNLTSAFFIFTWSWLSRLRAF